MPHDHPIEALFAALPCVEPYPKGVVPLSARLTGTGFFPGGAGLWGAAAGMPLPSMPVGGIMVLGHDVHSEAAFAKTLSRGAEVEPTTDAPKVQTWAGLLHLLRDVGVAPQQCFF